MSSPLTVLITKGVLPFTLVKDYIPPQVCVTEALQHLCDKEKKLSDSPIIYGDFNRANLTHEFPKYRQHIKCHTRDTTTLDHCHTVLYNPFLLCWHVALGLSDHCLIHLIQTYRQKLKKFTPVVRTVRK